MVTCSNSGYLGTNSKSTGTATVNGTESKWVISNELCIGQSGSGTLTVDDGGEVTAGTLWASLGDLHGNGTITATKGAVLDADLRFDAAHGTQQTLLFGTGGTLKVNVAAGDLGVGYKGNGSLNVAEGIAIASSNGYIGYYSGAMASASVSGAGSKWTNSGDYYVGRSGNGTLAIESRRGHQLSGYLGYNSGSTGTATITGTGSQWTTMDRLYVGNSGSGMLTIEASAQVINYSGYLGYDSDSMGTATITGTGSKWNNSVSLYVGNSGSGTLTIETGAEVNNSLATWVTIPAPRAWSL